VRDIHDSRHSPYAVLTHRPSTFVFSALIPAILFKKTTGYRASYGQARGNRLQLRDSHLPADIKPGRVVWHVYSRRDIAAHYPCRATHAAILGLSFVKTTDRLLCLFLSGHCPTTHLCRRLPASCSLDHPGIDWASVKFASGRIVASFKELAKLYIKKLREVLGGHVTTRSLYRDGTFSCLLPCPN